MPIFPYVITDPIKGRCLIKSKVTADTVEDAAVLALSQCRLTVGKNTTTLRICVTIDLTHHYERNDDLPPVVEAPAPETPATPAPGPAAK